LRDGRKTLGLALALVVATLASYAPLRENDFVLYDDNVYIYENPHLEAGLGTEGVAWAFCGGYEANWIPLTWLSLLLDRDLHGLDPRGYHATNLALHTGASLLLLLALVRMTGAPWRSGFVAAVFALHPLHVESVAWAAERKDALSGLFWMLTLFAYAGYARRPSPLRYAGVFASLALGLMAKPTLVTLPFVLLLLDAWPLGRLREPGSPRAVDPGRLRRCALEKLPLLPLVAASSLLTLQAQRAGGAIASLESFPLWVRVANAVRAYAFYAWQALWPRNLAIFYSHPGADVAAGQVLLAALFVLGVSAAAWRLRRRAPYLAVGWLFYLGTLIPMIGLVQVGSAAMADRHTYVPLIGLAIPLAWGAPALLAGWRRGPSALAALALIAVLAMGVASFRQVGVWRSSETLFEHALRVTGPNPVAHTNLGVEFLRTDRLREAEAHFEAAVRLRPRNADARAGLGSVAARQKRFEQARHHYRLALRLAPDLWEPYAGQGYGAAQRGEIANSIAYYFDAVRLAPERAALRVNLAEALASAGRTQDAIAQLEAALRLDPRLASAHAYLGKSLAAAGRPRAAIASYREALRIDPGLVRVHGPLAIALARVDQPEAALEHFERALQQQPELAELHVAMGMALARMGRDAEAALRYREALRRDPNSTDALNNLAWLLVTSGDEAVREPAEALALAERAVALRERRDPALLDTLAEALAANGRLREAERTASEALSLLDADDELAAALREKQRAWASRAGTAAR
jgi:tetratricopeptide (TPR) repeat protein